jgi:hypothetical protein
MKPSDPTAVSRRFAEVLARGLARADAEIAEHFARIRALPIDEAPATTPPWFRKLSSPSDFGDADDAWLDDDAPETGEVAPVTISGDRVPRAGNGRRRVGPAIHRRNGLSVSMADRTAHGQPRARRRQRA